MLDVTSKGPEPWQRFSPFYAHGGIPVPFSVGLAGVSIEGIWQGLKVFEGYGNSPCTKVAMVARMLMSTSSPSATALSTSANLSSGISSK